MTHDTPANTNLVLFDVDGTLVDSQHMICAAMHQAYDDHALPRPTHERVRSIIGLSLSDAFTHLAEGAEHPVEGLVERYKAAFFALREQPDSMESLYPGAHEAVTQLSRRVTLGVATGKSTRGVQAVLGHYKLLDLFTTIQTADTAPSKPDPGMVLNAMREIGVSAARTAVIGDSIYDMQMAKAAGARAIGVSWGYHPPADLTAAGADAIVENFAALEGALDRLWPVQVVNHA